MESILKVYVAEHCPGCTEAKNTAVRIEQDYPDVTVMVIDITDAPETVPTEVFATPTYMLNNRVVSLGNPGPKDISRWLNTQESVEVNQ